MVKGDDRTFARRGLSIGLGNPHCRPLGESPISLAAGQPFALSPAVKIRGRGKGFRDIL
jgi:hypothetical protein